MPKFQDVELKDGRILKANILVKTITSMLVRTEENEYKLISRSFLMDESKFKFRKD